MERLFVDKGLDAGKKFEYEMLEITKQAQECYNPINL
jgi:hypothetical protein